MNSTETSTRELVEQYSFAVVPDVLPGKTVEELTAVIEFALHRQPRIRRHTDGLCIWNSPPGHCQTDCGGQHEIKAPPAHQRGSRHHLVRRERQFADASAGGVMDGIENCRGDTDQAQFAQALRAERIHD